MYRQTEDVPSLVLMNIGYGFNNIWWCSSVIDFQEYELTLEFDADEKMCIYW